ncbi:phosphatidate cytidylyltransferase [Mucilaginibacter limnophilus]|uniref:Phosphatidate cytidylyltransferase n=1 Tax=Mucilaginibacter limnophilus TaxID=1932778 RepID=A0A3S2ULV1_9SPHI|nr:phosphatidate cytidylyltransferase [Mucilaginibacter limnophilus]RVU01452.1 phosphatidate cytidylyltransferase [Mucilaginibacter limnophilus]
MRLRAITGFFFIIVMLGSVLLGSMVFTAFYLVLSIFCLQEFNRLVKQSGPDPNLYTGLLNGFFVFTVFAAECYFPSNKLLFILPVLLGSIFVQELYKKSEAPFTNIAFCFLGILFTIIPFTFFHSMAFVGGEFNFHIPLSFLLMLWANDTGAYLVGSWMGRVKLFPRHSPKKTWEGYIGGIIITAGVALLLSRYYTEYEWKHWVAIGAFISVFGTMGDLIESMFKRSINVKDSGGILPGHGGLLDRFDGMLLSAPIVYAYLYLITNA